MKRGGFGSPYRPPADGWPRKLYSTGLYSNIVDDLNGLARYANNTNITLQPGQVGRPGTKPVQVDTSPESCEIQLNNGLPQGRWLGLYGDGTYLPPILGGHLRNTFAQNGTTDRGANCRQRGGKWVQAGRSWHGAFGWTSHDPAGCADTVCTPAASCDSGEVTVANYEAYQPTPDQTKYLTLTSSVSNVFTAIGEGPPGNVNTSSCSGSVSVDANSGQLTASMTNSELCEYGASPPTILHDVTNGYDSVSNSNHAFTVVDGLFAADVHCGDFPIPPGNRINPYGVQYTSLCGFSDNSPGTVAQLIADWNGQWSSNPLPPWVPMKNYSGSATQPRGTGGIGPASNTISIGVTYTQTSTTSSVAVTISAAYNSGDVGNADGFSLEFSATWTLSNPNTSASVYADAIGLLNYWDLSNDGIYPFRTDGVWQVAPLVTREEIGDQSPIQDYFSPMVDDKRSPVTDQNGNAPFTTLGVIPPGWTDGSNNNDSHGNPPGSPSYGGPAAWNPTYTQMAWFDPNAYGFVYGTDPVANKNGALALSWKQYALTGKILGMPMPTAFADPNSYWYDPGVSVGGTVCFEDFFDYNATLWKSCDTGTGADWYIQGYGEWLSDAIARTGAQLPFCATQWANNQVAKTIPPYASIVNYDKWQYSDSEGGEVLSSLPSIFAQKCCEIVEIWPSQDFFRPAGADKFLIDETQVYCSNGTVLYGQDDATPAASLNLTGYWGGSSVGGFYNGVTTDDSGNLTLGTKVLNVPSDWSTSSGDTGTAFGLLRFPTAPSILGRAAVTSAGTTFMFATPQTAFCMAIAGTESVDVYDINMNSLASGITATRLDDTHFTLPSTYASAAYVMIHGAPGYGWDDNMRKGDFVVYQWLFDFRTSGEYSRLQNVYDCSCASPPTISPANPVSVYQNPNASSGYNDGHGNTLVWDGAYFQGQGTIKYVPCSPCVICCSPNGETFHNGVVMGFPGSFTFDARYGARWQVEFEQAMIDLLYQGPHTPCGLVSPSSWKEDGLAGFCQPDAANGNGGTDHYFIGRPYVEARSALPSGAPALPSGITIGALNPVTNAGGLGAPGTPPPNYAGFNIGNGNPNGSWTWWGYRYTLESAACPPASCRFDYVDQENLACVTSASDTPAMVQAQPLSGLGGLS